MCTLCLPAFGFQSHCQRWLVWKDFNLSLDEISLDKENLARPTWCFTKMNESEDVFPAYKKQICKENL